MFTGPPADPCHPHLPRLHRLLAAARRCGLNVVDKAGLGLRAAVRVLAHTRMTGTRNVFSGDYGAEYGMNEICAAVHSI
jgi:hypothetical protein